MNQLKSWRNKFEGCVLDGDQHLPWFPSPSEWKPRSSANCSQPIQDQTLASLSSSPWAPPSGTLGASTTKAPSVVLSVTCVPLPQRPARHRSSVSKSPPLRNSSSLAASAKHPLRLWVLFSTLFVKLSLEYGKFQRRMNGTVEMAVTQWSQGNLITWVCCVVCSCQLFWTPRPSRVCLF